MFLAAAALCLAAFALLCWMMWDEITRVVRWQRKQHDRISKLEVHEKDQDSLLIRHDAQMGMIRRDVSAIGKDVGWSDDRTKTKALTTQKMFPEAKPDDEPPDDAA